MRVLLYERVSTEEQARHGYSLDTQDEALREFCKQNEHIILGVYRDEGISARKPYTKRPAMLDLLRDAEALKPDMILFTKLDRWFRNIKEYYKVQEILDKNRVDWKAIWEEYDTSTASGRLYINIKLSIAQDEADRTSERIKEIHSTLVGQGRVLGGTCPFCFDIKDKHLVHNDQGEILLDAIQHYKMHTSTYKTIRYINDKYDVVFSRTKLVNVFKNPLICGEYRNNPNFCEPYISREEFDELQALLGRNIKEASPSRTFLFSGMIKCPVCGSSMAGCFDGSRYYYRCNNRYYGLCDSTHNCSEKKLEKYVLENFYESFNAHIEIIEDYKPESDTKYVKRLQRLNDMYLYGNISAQEYKAKSQELQQRIAAVKRHNAHRPKPVVLDGDWKDLYQELDRDHRRSFWKALLREVKIDELGNGNEIVIL